MPAPLVTVAVVPRESFSAAPASLRSVLDNTRIDHDLVYIDGNGPRRIERRLRAALEDRDATYVRLDRYVSPNAARNVALSHVRTKYVAFVDNDVHVEAGWLEHLVERAERTGAWVVGGLEFQGELGRQEIHAAGSDVSFTGEPGRRWMHEGPRHMGQLLADVEEELDARACDVVEFHSMLVRMSTFDATGPLDEQLLSTREHIDLCLQVSRAGGSVWFEPASRITYPRQGLRPSDLPYFSRRWSEAWTRGTLERFVDKYELDPAYVSQRLAEVAAFRTFRYLGPLVEVARQVLPMRLFEGTKRSAVALERAVHRRLVD